LNFKEIWRIKSAVQLLKKTYGGKERIQFICKVLLVIAFAYIVYGFYGKVWPSSIEIPNHFEDAVKLIGLMPAGLGSLKFIFDFILTFKNDTNESKGDVLVKEAENIKDQIGKINEQSALRVD
jgi:hypothetical protein